MRPINYNPSSSKITLTLIGILLLLTLNRRNVVQADGPLSHCEMFLRPVQSSFIQFMINFLKFIPSNDTQTTPDSSHFDGNQPTEVLRGPTGVYVLEQIRHNSTFNALKHAGVDPYAPYKFFINGFNTLDKGGHINGTWMFETAKSFALRASRNDDQLGDNNLMFITWGIPEFLADDLLQMIPAYYKTMASYHVITRFVARTLENIVDYVEYHHQVDPNWPTSRARREYYETFQFFGHSLGSHLISDSILEVRQRRPELRFGKLMGLDPANPCFLSLEHGLSHLYLNESIDQLVVVHSNAGLAGLGSQRADAEIVLNGGTFQPGCKWLDFGCDHARSTDILGYVDDDCQMIAYRCSSYTHFKVGACDTGDRSLLSHENNNLFILVNLDEQHQDKEELLDLLDGQLEIGPIRQLAEDVELDKMRGAIDKRRAKDLNETTQQKRLNRRLKHLNKYRTLLNDYNGNNQSANLFNFYVNTNPNFRQRIKSHCLQHYQLRLIVQYPNDHIQKECPMSSFFLDSGSTFRLSLLYETLGRETRQLGHNFGNDRYRSGARGRKVENVIKDVLYTSLVNLEGSQKLFVGALVNNIDLSKLSSCLRRQGSKTDEELKFVLDVAFMSHKNERVRHAFSSVLCGHWNSNNTDDHDVHNRNNFNNNNRINLNDGGDEANNNVQSMKNGLILELCKESQLSNVSGQIDELIDKLKDEEFHESWKLSLLNNLFSLFVEWEPF